MRLRLMLSGKGVKSTPRPRRKGPGLGGLLKKAFRAVGVKPCGGCDERARKLDRASDKLRF